MQYTKEAINDHRKNHCHIYKYVQYYNILSETLVE